MCLSHYYSILISTDCSKNSLFVTTAFVIPGSDALEVKPVVMGVCVVTRCCCGSLVSVRLVDSRLVLADHSLSMLTDFPVTGTFKHMKITDLQLGF